MKSKKFTSNSDRLSNVVINWNEEDKGIIIFECAVKYLESKYGNELHKISGESLVSITLKEPSFWEWYNRIVNIHEKCFCDICENKGMRVPIEAYRLSIQTIEKNYNINKAVTYSKHKQELKSKFLIHK